MTEKYLWKFINEKDSFLFTFHHRQRVERVYAEVERRKWEHRTEIENTQTRRRFDEFLVHLIRSESAERAVGWANSPRDAAGVRLWPTPNDSILELLLTHKFFASSCY